ncbi:putative DNA polymerase [Sphingomonas phage vB_StuS_MMDA13]|uniref:Putative DNA polymerase n=1 Tax=Sphingomonas phage vB_StuS_MMDA13 TaxID=2686378 RepID=A0A7G3PHI2_9CAUD|nr:putative DNA polymerase [Sphingomonas phage vB_StuS_MMDA13]QHB80459.1 putative DNA polymerase [Sphingomonas phage vB_StuS_MMDA13]
MARNDSIGFFWDDTPPPKPPKKEQVKRIPPKPTWLDPSYLPGLAEALRFPVQYMTLEDLAIARQQRQELITDVECYGNYFLVIFTNLVTGKIALVEEYEGGPPLDRRKLKWLLENYTCVTFNGINYDIPMCEMAVHGLSLAALKRASDQIIAEEMRGSDVRRKNKAQAIKCDHIDLIEVAPLFASLKGYAGRMHSRKMQDLPFHPATLLSPEQIAIVRWYCVNDTHNTAHLRETLKEQIELRYTLSNEYKVDLRSKSDAQIAEAVMAAELQRRTGVRPKKPEIEVGTTFRYQVPPWMQFRSPLMQWALGVVARAKFVVDYTGSIAMPEEIKDLKLDINGTIYTMGIGGLHSTESTVAHHTDKDYIIIDKDVESFYPRIILNQGMYPEHLGPVFLQVYRTIVDRRLKAKADGNKPVADSLKIVINGSFGKFGSKYSILYAPNFLTQTTLTGQLSILLLIEMLEYAGIHVVSANTDGIVIKCPRNAVHVLDAVVAEWEQRTQYKTEETRYLSLYSRDVNNYIAVKQKFDKATNTWLEVPDGTKCKGAYANPWNDPKNLAMRLHKNPTTTVCVEAVEALLIKGVPLDHTIRNERDIRKFVTVRSVKGGAVKVWSSTIPEHSSKEELIRAAGFIEFAKDSWIREGESDRYARHTETAYKVACEQLAVPGETEFVGKTVRWYYAKNVEGELVYAMSGNKVPRSDGAMPCMAYNDNHLVPDDVDHDWYINEATRILRDIGAIQEQAA